ncbi:hypothetical protein Hanom_Chr07g00659991 [Helianthus anomalus]
MYCVFRSMTEEEKEGVETVVCSSFFLSRYFAFKIFCCLSTVFFYYTLYSFVCIRSSKLCLWEKIFYTFGPKAFDVLVLTQNYLGYNFYL